MLIFSHVSVSLNKFPCRFKLVFDAQSGFGLAVMLVESQTIVEPGEDIRA